MSFVKKTLTSAAWSLSSGYSNILIGFIGNLLLARIVLPEDFGIFSLASSILVFVTMFTGFGSQEAIVQCRDESIKDLIPTAFWISLGLGCIVAIAGILVGFAVWSHYGRTTSLIIISLSVMVPFTSFMNSQAAVLMRDMELKPVVLTQTISNAGSFILGVFAALLGGGPWALVVRQVSLSIFFMFGMKISSRYRLEKVYNKEAALWIWNFGWKKMLIQFNDIIFGRFDSLIIGTFIGVTQLGYYSQSYRLAMLGQQFTEGAIAPILWPMFATIQFSVDKLRYSFERVNFWIIRVVLLLGILVLLSGKSVVIFLYGLKWAISGQYFQIMFIFFMFLPIAAMLKNFLIGAGHIDKALKIGWIQVVFFIVGVSIGVFLKNVIFVIWAVNINYVLGVLMMSMEARKIISINWIYLCAKPALTFSITILLGFQLVILIPETFLGMLLLIFLVCFLYFTILMLFEYRSFRLEINTILMASRKK